MSGPLGPSDLTTSGLLYEGNFDEWLPRMRAILSQQHDATIIFYDVSGGTNREEVADTIWWQVSRHVRTRTPETSRKNPSRLIKALHEVARPFRLDDLSPEVRIRIYSMVFSSHNDFCVPLPMENYRVLRESPNKDGRSVLCVGRRMRAEALPLYYKDRQVCFMWHRAVQRHAGLGAEIAKSINGWASMLTPETLKSLRNISLHIFGPTTHYNIRLSLVMVGGSPEIRYDHEMARNKKALYLVREHAATVSRVTQVLKLQGEALILFLTCRPDMWDRMPEVQD